MCRPLQTTIKGSYSLLNSNNENEPAGFVFAFQSKKVSPIWGEYLEAVNPKQGTAHVVCKHCKQVFHHPNHDTHRSVSFMHKHLASCHKYKRTQHEVARQRRLAEGSSNSPALDLLDSLFEPQRGPMTNERLTEQVLRIIIAGNLSFSQAENPKLVNLLHDAFPTCKPPSRHAIADRLRTSTFNSKEKLREQLAQLESKVSLCVDAWRSRGNVEFLGMFSFFVTGGMICESALPLLLLHFELSLMITAITGHYIDHNWNLCKPLLGFEKFEGRHTGVNGYHHIQTPEGV
jgi:hypothetical protein